jgi:hypothetical protein
MTLVRNRWQRAFASAVTLVVAAVVGGVVLVSVTGGATQCRTGSVAQLDSEQRANAAVIMQAGQDLGLSVRDQAIGVMTAMGESSLRNLDYGDWETSGVRNPDGRPTTSLGLFQQQDEWGSRESRLDPYIAATLFYRAMVDEVPESERTGLAPTLVAHRTQVNERPAHYARYWPTAVAVVDELAGTDTDLDGAVGAC